jgi:AcrR family transcriptional regulator
MVVVARRRAQMVEETRAKLIHAARKAFATKGYAAASMDDLTAEAGLTRGALYHNFGDKKGLLQAVIDQIDAEMVARMHAVQDRAETRWLGLLDEGVAYIEMALEPEIQRIMLLDGPAVLGREEMDAIDNRHGNRTLREGLMAAMQSREIPRLPLDAL